MTDTLPEKLVAKAIKQLQASYTFKLPRITQIRKYRDLYNGRVPKQLRIRYNVPIPIFSGMIDTLQADLDDALILKYQEQDPADWMAIQKLNAAVQLESASMRPGAKWNAKFRDARQDCLFTGRGILKYTASSEGGFTSNLEMVPFEDFYFEPKGGNDLNLHLFQHQDKIWKLRAELESEAGGIYDAQGVAKLLTLSEGSEVKASGIWDAFDFANRFLPLGLTPDGNDYVGEPLYHCVESVIKHEGKDWYLLWEAYTGTALRCEKLSEVNSAGYGPWISFASHADPKNFASKSFADDLYPHAMAMTDLFNEDMENRRRRNSAARGYDKDMVPNVEQLDQAQIGRDKLVALDTKGGARRISEAIYEFSTPELTGTIDMLQYMNDLIGRNVGVNDMQQGASQDASKKVGVAYAELSNINKRLAFSEQPIIEAGQQLGVLFWIGLKDYMTEPLAIKLYGETGYQWEQLKRVDLNMTRDPEILVMSQAKENRGNELAKENRLGALQGIAGNPILAAKVNQRVIAESMLRDIGGYSEAEIALFMDTNNEADKLTVAQTSEAIQDLMNGRVPPINYNATAYFMQRILDFVKTHQGDPKIEKNFDRFMAYIDSHKSIAAANEARRAHDDVRALNPVANAANVAQGGQPGAPTAPLPSPISGMTAPIPS